LPSCKAEFRIGFRQCSDSHIPLVATESEARHTPVEELWKGSDRDECNRILSSLAAADVPSHSEEHVVARPWPWFSMLLWRFMKPRPTYELQISVLGSDVERARAAIPPVVDDLEEGLA